MAASFLFSFKLLNPLYLSNLLFHIQLREITTSLMSLTIISFYLLPYYFFKIVVVYIRNTFFSFISFCNSKISSHQEQIVVILKKFTVSVY